MSSAFPLELEQKVLQLCRMMADPQRLKILTMLCREPELHVSALCQRLQQSQPAVSHHLRTLRNLHLVRVRRDGRTSFYALEDEHIERLLHEGIEHVEDLLK